MMKKFYKVNISIVAKLTKPDEVVGGLFEKYYLSDEGVEAVRKQAILDYLNFYKNEFSIYPEDIDRCKTSKGKEVEMFQGKSTRIGYNIHYGEYYGYILLVDLLTFDIDTTTGKIFRDDIDEDDGR